MFKFTEIVDFGVYKRQNLFRKDSNPEEFLFLYVPEKLEFQIFSGKKEELEKFFNSLSATDKGNVQWVNL